MKPSSDSTVQALLSEIAARPSLKEWLQARLWRKSFTMAMLERGKGIFENSLVNDLLWEANSTRAPFTIGASVQGGRTNPYVTEIDFYRHEGTKWRVDTECECPVFEDCKHAAALLMWLAAALGEQAEQPGEEAQLHQWRETFDNWLGELGKAAKESALAAPKKPSVSKKFLAYCIEKVRDGPYIFTLRRGQHAGPGKVLMEDGLPQADPAKPASYMTEEDTMPALLYRRLMGTQDRWSALEIGGPGWDELLDKSLATGRLFFGDHPLYRQNLGNFKALASGPPEPMAAVWETLENGEAKPVIRSRAGLILLPTQPARYLDIAAGLIGLVESETSALILEAWPQGPTIPAKQLHHATEKLTGLTARVPVPVKYEEEVRPGSPPQPILHIRRRSFPGYYGRPVSAIVGELFFSYGDSPRVPMARGANPASHTAVIAGKRITWPRDPKAEDKRRKQLLRLAFIDAAIVISTARQEAHLPFPVVPALTREAQTQELRWAMALASTAVEKMREDGWQIEIDSDCKVAVHTAEAFVPAIEHDPEHGIDWFRFDMTFEVDGQPLSLIPVIAQMIATGFPPPNAKPKDIPEYMVIPDTRPQGGFIRFPTQRLLTILEQIRHLFTGVGGDGELRLDRLSAAGVASEMAIDSSATTRALAELGRNLKNIRALPEAAVPASVKAELRPYQHEGFRWLQFLGAHGLHGILADDMGLGKTLQTLTHLAAEVEKKPGRPSLVIAPTSVAPNWAAEAERFTPHLKTLLLHGPDRAARFPEIAGVDLVITTYPLLVRDFETISAQDWQVLALDEAQYIKNPKAIVAQNACRLKAAHRLCLSGTPIENHLGELWSLMRFLMPGLLGDEKTFNSIFRRPIEKDPRSSAQVALNRRAGPLILRRTKDQVAADLPEKTQIVHGIDLTRQQADLYESVRATMDKRVRDAIAAQGLAKSHIVVLDALLKLRQICCHPGLLKTAAGKKDTPSAKLTYLTEELLPQLLEEGRRILLFSQFTSMLAIIEEHLKKENIPYLKLTGQTKERAELVKTFQKGETPVFLISLKAGGSGLNLTAADTVIHYDPWWNPAAENQATDRAHRIGQVKPVFVHKLVCRGTIEDRILDLQKRKSALVESLLSDEATSIKLDEKTLSHLLAPLEAAVD